MCVWTCRGARVKLRRQLSGAGSLHSVDSGHQAWGQVSLLAEPSHQPRFIDFCSLLPAFFFGHVSHLQPVPGLQGRRLGGRFETLLFSSRNIVHSCKTFLKTQIPLSLTWAVALGVLSSQGSF